MADTTVTARFRADTSDVQTKLAALQREMSATEKKFASAGASMQSVGKKMTLGVTAPLAAIGVAAAKTAMDFETSMSKIVGLVGLSTDEVSGMRDSVLELSGATAKAPAELADALFVVTSAGLRGNDAMNALESAAKASTAGLGETADIARSVAGAMNAYGPATLDAAKATDVIVATARAGNFETSQFAAAIGRVLPFAKQAGSSIEDMGGAVALLTRTNGDAAQSVTQVAALFRAFVVPTEEAKKALDSVGLSAADMRDAIAEQGLPAALTMLEDKLGGNREQLGRLLGSSEAASAAFQILDADAESIAGTFGTVQDSVGMTDDAFGAAAETAGFKMQQALQTLQASLIQIGDILLPIISSMTEFASGVLNRFNDMNPAVKTAAVLFGAVAAALGPLFWIGGKIITSIALMRARWTLLATSVKTATRSIGTRVKTMEVEIKAAMIKSRTQLGAFGAAAGVVGKKIILSFRSIGVAAKGLIASFGPIGIALTALTVGFEIFMNQSAESEAAVDRLRDTIDETTGAFTDLTAEMIARDLTMNIDPAAISAAESVGITVADMTAALIEGDDAVKEIGQRFNDAIDPTSRFYNTFFEPAALIEMERRFGGAAKNVDTLRRDLQNSEVAADNAKDAIEQTGLTAGTAAGDFNDLDREITDANDALKDLNEMFSTFDANVAAIRAKDELSAYYRDIDKAIAENNRSLTGNGKAAMANREAVLKAFDLAKADAEAWGRANNATLAQVETRFQKNTETLRQTLLDEGFTQEEIERFFGSDYVDAASVAVQGQMTSGIGTLADKLGPVALREMKGVGRSLVRGVEDIESDVGPSAAAAGRGIGRQMANGLIAGINAGIPPMEREASAAAQAAEDAFKKEAGIASPSKVFEKLGNNLMQGLEKGIADLSDEAADEARDAVQKAVDAATEAIGEWEDYRDSVQDALVSTLDLGQAYEDYTARQQAVTEALAALHEHQATIQGEATDQQKTKLAELQAAYDEAKDAAASGAQSIVDEFVEQGKKAAAFGENLQTLLANDLSKQAFDAIIREGGERGADIAAALVEGNVSENVRRVNEVYTSVSNMGREVGTQSADSFFGAGVTLALEALKGMIKEFLPGGKKRKELLRAINNLDKSIRFEPKYLDIVTRRYEIGQAPPTVAPAQYAGATASAEVASQFSQEVLNNAQRLNAAAAAGQDVTQLGFNRADWAALAELERANIAALATGGIVTAPTMALIGEAGPEAVVPLSGRNAPNMGNTTVNVTINAGVGTDGAEVGRQVVEAIRKYERRSGPVFASA